MELEKQIEMLEENIICLKAGIIQAKQIKQKADERYKGEKDRLEKNIQEMQVELANLKSRKENEDWEPMTDIAVDLWIEKELEKD